MSDVATTVDGPGQWLEAIAFDEVLGADLLVGSNGNVTVHPWTDRTVSPFSPAAAELAERVGGEPA